MNPAKARLLLVAGAAVAFVATAAPAAFSQPFNDRLVQPASLAAPERGSVKGPLSELAFAPSALGRGSFQLPLPIAVPQERGPLQAGVIPSYSPDGGLSEWGMGWSSSLSIERRRQLGELDFVTDELASPWGPLRAGDDGFFYPAGLKEPLRLAMVERSSAARVSEAIGGALHALLTGAVAPQVAPHDWLATAFDGTQYRFSATAGVMTSEGSFSWQLTEVTGLEGDRTVLVWQKNASGRPFLAQVTWGERGGPAQYQLDLTYEAAPGVPPSYASGTALHLDRRVRRVVVAARDAGTAAMHERWRYDLTYDAAPFGPSFYLKTVQRTFASGEAEPVMRYTYELGAARLSQAPLEHYTGLDALYAAVGDGVLQPDRSALHDVDNDGRPDLELADDLSLVRHADAGWVRTSLPPATGAHPNCRPSLGLGAPPRTLVRLTADLGEPHVVAISIAGTAPLSTQLLACDRLGRPLADLDIPDDWTLGPNTRLVDIDRDRRPDIVRVSADGVDVLRNLSDASGIHFAALPRFSWLLPFSPELTWFHDFNGDGIQDVVTRLPDALVVYYGLGRYRWSTTPLVLELQTQVGFPLSQLDTWALTFVDANKDGLADVLITRSIDAVLFTNRGDSLIETPVAGFGALFATLGVPVVADVTGRGATEVAFPALGTTYFVEVASAATGLMTSADDGAGTVARFTYERSTPAAGVEQRVTVLDALTLESSGEPAVTSTYAFTGPVTHSVSRQLIGFASAERASPYLTEQVAFHHDDDVNGLVTGSQTLDGRSALVRFAASVHQEATLAGVRFLRETSATSGTRRGDGTGAISTTTTHEAFDRTLCPTRTRVVTPSGTLLTESILASVPALGALPHCTPAALTLTGQHANAALDFSYQAELERNALGQPTRIRQLAGGTSRVLQEVTYGDRNRPTRVFQPGLGEVLVHYDAATGLLREVVAADGVVTTSRDRDPVTDGLRELGIDRGGAPWLSGFQYDGQERLWKSWDDLGVSSAASPGIELSYAFAGAATPGRIRTRTMVAPGSYLEVVDLTSASGASLATLGRLPDGWRVNGLTTVDRRELESRTFWRGPLSSSIDLASLSWTALRAGATQLGLSRSSGGGLAISSEQVLGAGVTRQVAASEALVGDTVVTTSVENGAFTTQSAADAAGDVRWTKDETGATTQLAYDALGRLVGVTLADGTPHALRYDGYGKLAEVGRPGLATVRYEYDPATGLATRKRVLDGDGALERTIEWTRDAIGRITAELHTQPRTGASRSFAYHHDGLIDGVVEPGQRGKLSQVVGPDFVRTARFERDGSPRSTSLRIANWRQVDQAWAQFEDGSVREETWVIRDGAGQELSRLVQTNIRDVWGRPAEIRVNGAPFVTFAYDPEGRIDAVYFADGSELIPSYDLTTHARNGHWADMRAWVSGSFWSYNARGQIASEHLTTDGAFWERAHEYDARGMLVRTHDEASESRSSYGPTGLPTSMTDLTGQRTLSRTGRTIGVEAAAGGPYQLDASGRVISHDGLTLTWGPTGEIDTASRGARTWSYLYDDAGQRIGKREGSTMIAGYVGTLVLEETRAVLPVKLAGVLVGFWELTSAGHQFQPVSADTRGTLLKDSAGANPATPYGVRARRLPESAALDYIERGYDADLGTVRFGVRDYDPKLGQFWSPDPLFLEDIEKCAASPLECNLYGYAKGNPLSWIDRSGMDARGVVMYTECEGCGRISQAVSISKRYTSIGLNNGYFEIGYLGSDNFEYVLSFPMNQMRGEGPGGYTQLPGNVYAPVLWNAASSPEIAMGMAQIAAVYEAQANGAIAAMQGFETVLNYMSALQAANSVFTRSPVGKTPAPAASGAPSTAGAAAQSLPRLPRSLGAAANIVTRSRIGSSTYATGLAKEMGQAAQRNVDSLLTQLRAGNMNPGIGTRALGEGFFELRGANAGRVIVKQTSTGFDIVGKFQAHVRGDAANSAIIRRLMRDYNAL